MIATLLRIFQTLETRYDDELQNFNDKIAHDEYPLWMRQSDIMAAKALLQAKRDVLSDLASELRKATTNVLPENL